MPNPTILALATLALASFAYIFLPPLYLFALSIENGITWINHIYPYSQSSSPLKTNPIPIYTHIYLNTLSLLILLLILLLSLHPPHIPIARHRILAWTYTSLLIPGTLSSLLYASHQPYGGTNRDAGKAGHFAFSVMALATLYTLSTTLYYSGFSSCFSFVSVMTSVKNPTLHREWAIRNFAVLFGNGVGFRILANTYLVWMSGGAEGGGRGWGADFYAAWCQMIYLAWMIPLGVAEWYLSWERNAKREDGGKKIVTKEDSSFVVEKS